MRLFEGGVLVLLALAAAAVWRFVFAMPQEPISSEALIAEYQVPAGELSSPLTLEFLSETRARFQLKALDGDTVRGFIEWPVPPATLGDKRLPVLLGLSAMGQSAQRWWLAEYKGKPTLTQTHQIRAMAIASGYALLTVENRYTDSRKHSDYDIDGIMSRLHLWGDKNDYEKMVHGTVMDIRQTLDAFATRPELDLRSITAVGYSMGAQVGFLLAGVDTRVGKLVAVVPPWLDDSTARVAPKNAAPLIRDIPVLLITGDDDEYASQAQNQHLFEAIASTQKRHLRIKAGHLLPPDYVEALRGELSNGPTVPMLAPH